MNVSTFECNAMHAFRGVADDDALLDEAEAVFLNQGGGVQAEALALEHLSLSNRLAPMLAAAAKPFEGDHGAREFIRDRWFHYRCPTQGRGTFPARIAQ